MLSAGAGTMQALTARADVRHLSTVVGIECLEGVVESYYSCVT